jgi:Glycosyltransferase
LRGGLASFNERLCRAFIQEGHRAKITTFSLQYPNFLFPGTTQYSDEKKPTDIQIDIKINSINALNWIRIGLQLKRLKPDIIVVRYWLPFMGPCLGTILRIVKKNIFTKVICIADNIIPHEKRPGDTLFTRYFVRPIDAFLTMSEKVRADLKFFSSKPSRFIPHPLYDNFGEKVHKHEAREKLGLKNDVFTFLFFGFIRKYKGLDMLIEAVNELNKQEFLKNNNINILVAGEFYEEATPYLEAIQQYELQDFFVLHTHFIADSWVKYYLSAADCVVQPYHHATQSGVTPLAYHFEVPMIVTKVGALPDMVPPSVGHVCEPNPNSLAKAMMEMTQQTLENFEQAIKIEKQKYSWHRIVEAVLYLAEDKHNDLS